MSQHPDDTAADEPSEAADPAAPRATQSSRWTNDEVQRLLAAARRAGRGQLQGVFERFAQEKGTSSASVRTKYYAVRNGGRSARRGSRRGATWSKQLESRLLREVADAGPGERQRVFQEWAARRGVSVDAIQQRYYRIRRSRLQAEAPAGRTASTATTATAERPSRQGFELGAVGDLSSLSMLELAALARQANVELERRVTMLQQSVGAS